MTDRLTRTQVRCRAEIRRNSYGTFLVWLSGAGYKTPWELPDFVEEPRAAEDALDALVSNGYELLDPDNLIRLYDLFDDDANAAEQDADSAGYPGIGGYIGSTPGDNGRDGTDDDELVF